MPCSVTLSEAKGLRTEDTKPVAIARFFASLRMTNQENA